MPSMKGELARRTARALGESPRRVERIAAEYFRQINNTLVEDGIVTLDGLGTLTVFTCEPKSPVMLCSSGLRSEMREVEVPAFQRVSFSMSKTLKQRFRDLRNEE